MLGDNKLKIGVFGGSFDPVHLEHTKIADVAFKEFNVDKIIIVPAYKPPHKNALNVSAQHRLNMLKLAVENLQNVFIDCFEINSKKSVYTFETMDYLHQKYYNDSLKLIIGQDSYNQLDNWRKSEYIAEKYGFFVVRRNGLTINKNSRFFKYSVFSNFVGTISSTEVRTKIEQATDVSSLLDNKVLNYIKQNNLYINKK